MTELRDFVNPRVLEIPEYDQKHVTLCWQNEGKIQRLMSNESSYPPMRAVQKAIKKTVSKANWYAEDANYAMSIRSKLAFYTGLKPENITLGNGSMELLDLMFQTFIANPGVDQIVLPAPDYSAYPIRASLFGWVTRQTIFGEQINQLAEKILSAITPQTKMVLLSRPNNPTGKLIPKNHVLRLLESGILVAVDEAYIELADEGTSLSSLINEWENLLVLRTFSKGFGLAGLRLGYVLGNPEIIKYINLTRHIFNVNLLAMVAGEVVLDNLEEAQLVLEEQRQTRDYLIKELSKIPGLRPLDSQANFVLVDVGDSDNDVSDYVDFLYKHGFFVRDFSKKYGLEQGRYFRITIGLPKHIQQLINVLSNM